MKKKGSHVGIILSFVIFITFLVFLYSIIEPKIGFQMDKEALLDHLKIELIKEISANLTSITVSIDGEASSNCVNLKNFIGESEVNSHLIIKDENGIIVPSSYISAENGNDLLIERSDVQQVFFKVYNSEEFEELDESTISGCTELEKDEEGYSITLTKVAKYIFENKVIDLLSRYENENSYEVLRDELRIPQGSDFGFDFIYSDDNVLESKEKEMPANVYVREIPVQYVDEESTIFLGKINIKAW